MYYMYIYIDKYTSILSDVYVNALLYIFIFTFEKHILTHTGVICNSNIMITCIYNTFIWFWRYFIDKFLW